MAAVRQEDRGLVTGSTRFVADIPFDGLHAAFARSTEPHGTIVAVDTADAAAVAGVVAVETSDTLALDAFEHLAALDARHARHPLADGTVRHVGEAVAVVVAASEPAAVDAVELVAIDIDPLPPVVDPGRNDPLLYPASGTNETASIDREGPDALDAADVIVELELINPRIASAPVENDGIIATPTPDGGLDIVCTSQGVHAVRDDLARALELDAERLLSLIHISEPTRHICLSRMPSSA